MRLAILSDIHANWAALQAVWQDLEEQGVDSVYSLGDNVGYGPSPQEVVAFLHNHNVPSVQGNHERGLTNPASRAWFNPHARQALEQTRALMDPQWITVLSHYPLYRVVQGARLVHGAPPDSAHTYLFEWDDGELPELFTRFSETLCFVGHTHELMLVCLESGRARRDVLRRGVFALEAGSRYVVNVGSVGQPRDGDNRAKYVIWDTEQASLEVRFVAYDIQDTVDRIGACGLPRANATRLW
ncbi:metallophosphoesterase family protein [Desulfohalobium retbaense]|uniref:Metallophosphoesterase n=1 Tax=Desulfohalobium retbaense (strain ATCC 49708 / DSM 5692 / JCM 16813 / HR100) TaxID=485915 RepID=C8X3J7_DESRD|nr:metallophosphoesterase family protein [Desulfohalobium retbaense]ACV68994.1 metallophosphoesterase [Desulfohalobium retbaense DSM 5692]